MQECRNNRSFRVKTGEAFTQACGADAGDRLRWVAVTSGETAGSGTGPVLGSGASHWNVSGTGYDGLIYE